MIPNLTDYGPGGEAGFFAFGGGRTRRPAWDRRLRWFRSPPRKPLRSIGVALNRAARAPVASLMSRLRSSSPFGGGIW
jgi:hypothetical protein